MYGAASLAEAAFAEGVDGAEPIIPEIGLETRTLVFVVEVDLISPAVE
jgi:hypothetical protein